VRILVWHVHGSWTTAFVEGRHDYLIPVTPDRDSDGLGRDSADTLSRQVARQQHVDRADQKDQHLFRETRQCQEEHQ